MDATNRVPGRDAPRRHGKPAEAGGARDPRYATARPVTTVNAALALERTAVSRPRQAGWSSSASAATALMRPQFFAPSSSRSANGSGTMESTKREVAQVALRSALAVGPSRRGLQHQGAGEVGARDAAGPTVCRDIDELTAAEGVGASADGDGLGTAADGEIGSRAGALRREEVDRDRSPHKAR